jgi:endoglucanase Acf2
MRMTMITTGLTAVTGGAMIIAAVVTRLQTGAAPMNNLPSPALGDRSTMASELPWGLSRPKIPAGTIRPFPTNAWWSSGALEDWPAPLYAWPLVTRFQPDGIIIDAPSATVGGNAVMNTAADPLRIFDPAASFTRASPKSFGDWDVTFAVHDAKKQNAVTATAVQGSPFVWMKSAKRALSVVLPANAKKTAVKCGTNCKSAYLIEGQKNRYLIASDGALTVNEGVLNLKHTANGGWLSVAILAPGSKPETYLPYVAKPVTDTRVTFDTDASSVKTTYAFPQKTIAGVMPHQAPVLARKPGTLIGTVQSVHGPIDFYEVTNFSTVLPRPYLLPALPVQKSLSSDKAFMAQLKTDIEQQPPATGDTYNAGKMLLRTAQLADIADTAGNPALKNQALEKLRKSLGDWCTTDKKDHSFVYDAAFGGVIGLPTSFGSEHFNDHHFHYGYFIQAAAVLARHDPAFVKTHGKCIDLLIRDIASTDRKDPSFPYMRSFDPYMGHGWANGLTLMADGNNQESTSEAMQAWMGIALWGKATGNADLEKRGTWMLAQEAASTKTYWFNAGPVSTLPAQFPHPMISILWGGKADYATFFDGSDGAIRGIQLFPVQTALLQVADKAIATKIIDPILKAEDHSMWATTLRMASAMTTPGISLPDDSVLDPVYSKSYLRHWMSALSALGTVRSDIRFSCAGAAFERNRTVTAVIYVFPNDSTSCTVTTGNTKRTLSGLRRGWNERTL